MCHKDKSIGNPPAQPDAQTDGIASKGFVLRVVDEGGKGVVVECCLDGCDGGGDVFWCD
jgi:hypothetical protein